MERQKTKSRSKRLEEARALIEQLNEDMEAETYGLSDAARNSDKANRINETQSTLRQILDLMENIEFPSLSQPDHRKRA